MVDSSALAKYVLREEGWERVGSLIRGERPLYTVDHALKEVGNAIWKHCTVKRIIDKETALTLYWRLLKLFDTGVIVAEPESKYVGEALKLSLELNMTVYDALYVAQARVRGRLLTCDKNQAEAAERLGIPVHLVP